MTHGEIWTIDFGDPIGSLPSSEENYEKLVQAVHKLISEKT